MEHFLLLIFLNSLVYHCVPYAWNGKDVARCILVWLAVQTLFALMASEWGSLLSVGVRLVGHLSIE